MATSGQLKTRIDRLTKKIVEKGASMPPDKKRVFAKKLKRWQRARRVALAMEKRRAAPAKEEKEEKAAAAPPAS
jgi:hypothetical protein